MLEKTLTIKNRLGLHARPAALFAQTASRYQAAVKVCRDDLEVNGKSVMGLMMLAAEQGCKLRIIIEGQDEKQALKDIEALFDKKFDED